MSMMYRITQISNNKMVDAHVPGGGVERDFIGLK
jgi:hypothetical protein